MNSNYYEQIRRAFNDWAPTYEGEVVQKLIQRGYSYEILGKKFASYISSSSNEKPVVIELGVGTGILGVSVARLCNMDLYGVDISEKMLEIASEKRVYLGLTCCNVDTYNFPKGVDVIYSGFMLHSVKMQERLIESAYESLHDNGYLLIADLVPSVCEYRDFNAHSRKYEYGAPSNYKKNNELISMFNDSLFELVHVERLGKIKDYTHFFYALCKPQPDAQVGS